jgi:IS1 family transposase
VSISAISRLCSLSWSTVFRWLKKATQAAKSFNDRHVRDFDLEEVQADEIRTFCGTKKKPSWIFMSIEVGPRLWISTVVGRRGYQSTRSLIRDTARRGRWTHFPLIATDGYKYYAFVIQRTFGVNCVYGQVIKSWRKDRITKVETKLVIGSKWRLEDALEESEDSHKLNTSFIERLNLTVRQGSAYLCRRTACHSRSEEHLRDQLELQRCHYNFLRPHRALQFGSEVRTPAMQAGLATKRLSFRDVFLSSRPDWRSNVTSMAGRRCRLEHARDSVAA